MSRESNINQFIPLHFYEVGERLPDDETNKIVICNDGEFCIGFYVHINDAWYVDNLNFDCIYNVIAWASFSPEWVTGTYPGEWGKQ